MLKISNVNPAQPRIRIPIVAIAHEIGRLPDASGRLLLMGCWRSCSRSSRSLRTHVPLDATQETTTATAAGSTAARVTNDFTDTTPTTRASAVRHSLRRLHD